MRKIKRILKRKGRKRGNVSKIGKAPGSIIYTGDITEQNGAHLELIEYKTDKLSKTSLENVNGIPPGDLSKHFWVRISGLHKTDLIDQLGKHLSISPLDLEDAVNLNQRSKVEIHKKYIFVLLKVLIWNEEDKQFEDQQLSIFCFENHLVTLQEKESDIFKPIYERMQTPGGRFKSFGSDYLMYAIIDLVVDYYMHALDKMDDIITQLSYEIEEDPSEEHPRFLNELKRQCLILRQAVQPIRYFYEELEHHQHAVIHPDIYEFYHDIHDHLTQVSENLQSVFDRIQGGVEAYRSVMNFRMNEIIKFLTIVSMVFIPLTFLAGIYGMNFDYIPELSWHYGYFAFWITGFVIVVSLIFFFKRKKWL